MTSPSVSLQRVMLPYALRDPYRISHYKSQAVPAASGRRRRSISSSLNNGANNGVVDMVMTGAADYAAALDRAMTAIYAGEDVAGPSTPCAKEWDAITNRLGVETQRAAYA